MIVRLVLFSIFLVSTTVAPAWFLVLCVVMYALKYTAYELMFLTVMVDALSSIGHQFVIPQYTISMCIVLLCIECIKPYISVYN